MKIETKENHHDQHLQEGEVFPRWIAYSLLLVALFFSPGLLVSRASPPISTGLAQSTSLSPFDEYEPPNGIYISQAPKIRASYVYHTTLMSPEGMEFGPDGDLYVADWLGKRIVKLDSTGEISTVAVHNQGGGSRDLGFGPDGTLYINDHNDIFALLNGILVPWAHSTDIINRMTVGPDAKVYFTERFTGNVMCVPAQNTTEVVTSCLATPDDLVFNAQVS